TKRKQPSQKLRWTSNAVASSGPIVPSRYSDARVTTSWQVYPLARSAIAVPLELGAHPHARAVEEDTLVSEADPERLADLVRVAAGHVAERDHGALGVRQLRDRTGDEVERLTCEQARLGQRPPVGRKRPPSARIRLAGAVEAPRVDEGLVVVVLERRERQRTCLADRPVAGDVGDDPQYPGAQARAALEPIDAPEDGEPRVLDDLFR